MTTGLKNLAFVLIILLSGHTVFAQSDAKAEDLLNTVSSKLKAYDNIGIKFKYELSNLNENTSEVTRGDVVMAGDKYRLNFFGVTRIFDGKTLYNIESYPDAEDGEEKGEVTVSSENIEDEGTITPSKMLSFYEDGYTYKMDIIQNVRGRKIQYVKLNPIDTNAEIDYILLGIDARTHHIYNLIEVGKNETKTTLTINSFKTNEPISKTLFTFDESKYKDYFINKID